MDSLEERRRPSHEAVEAGRLKRHADGDTEDGLPALSKLDVNFPKRKTGDSSIFGAKSLAAHRFARGGGEESKEQSGEADDEKGEPPRSDLSEQRQMERSDLGEGVHDGSADGEGERGTSQGAQIRDAHGGAQTFLRKVIGDQRKGGGIERRFAHANADSGEKQRQETPSNAAGGSENAPDQDSHNDEVAAVARVHEVTDGNARERIKEGESEALQQADTRVTENEIALDGSHEQAEDLAIDEGEHVAERQDSDDVPGVSDIPVSWRKRAGTGG